MQFVNRLGKILLSVTSADCDMDESMRPMRVLYSYTGEGCGGYTDLVGIQRLFDCMARDHVSLRVEGFLPEPKVRVRHAT